MFTDNPNVSRRTVAKTAAWSVPAVAVVSAAPTFAASHHEQEIVRNLTFRVFVRLNGAPPVIVEDNPPYATPPGSINQEIWDVVATTTIPTTVAPNTAIPAPPLSTAITTSVTAADTLRTFAVTSVNGTAAPTYTINGSVANPGLRSANLVVPTIQTPATGGIVTVASGSAQAETSTSAGTINQFVGKFSSVINCTPNVPISSMGLAGALEPAGQANDFGEIIVG